MHSVRQSGREKRRDRTAGVLRAQDAVAEIEGLATETAEDRETPQANESQTREIEEAKDAEQEIEKAASSTPAQDFQSQSRERGVRGTSV